MPTTILLVEDDPVVRRVLERTIGTEERLRRLEPRFLHAGEGRKGLALLKSDHPDLVITDLFMPGMDGFAFCRELRQQPEGRSVPLLVISGVYKDPALTDGLTKEFGAKFLAKPVAAADLAAAILDLMVPRAASSPAIPVAEPATAPDAAPVPVSIAAVPVPLPPIADMLASGSIQGSLAARPLPALLAELISTRATGTLTLLRGKMGKEIFLREGHAVGAESNLRQEALGTLLLGRGVIDEHQLAFLLAEIKSRNQKMGTVLVELGWLSPEDVLQYLAAQARKRVVDCLRWVDGTFNFQAGEEFADRIIEHDLEIEKLLFRGLQRTAAPELLLGRLDQDGARPIRLTGRFDFFRAAFESVFGGVLPGLLGQGTSTGQGTGPLVGSLILRPDSASLVLGIEALLLTGMAELGEASPEAEERTRPEKTDSFSLERLGAEISGAFKLIDPTPVDDLFGQSDHALDVLAPRPDILAPDTTPEATVYGDSGVIALSERPQTRTGVAVPLPPAPETTEVTQRPGADRRRALLIEYLDVHGKAPHDVLKVSPAATRSEIAAALDEKMQRFSPGAFADLELGEDAPKLAALQSAYQRAWKTLSEPPVVKAVARVEATTALAPDDTDPLGAELAFGMGLSQLSSGEHQPAIAHFEAATKARPDQAAYHAYHGWALYVARGEVSADEARSHLLHALTLDPDLAEAHEFLGRIAVGEDDDQEGRLHLERTLEIDPAQPDVVEILVRLYSRSGDLAATEQLYRHVIARLGERALPLRRRMWKELADLYEGELGSRSSARIAYEMAARLAPDDLAIQRKVVELNAEDPARWREITRALTAELRANAEDREVGGALLDLLRRAGRQDAAAVTAAGLTLRGSADAAARKTAEQSKPRLLPRLSMPITEVVLTKLGYTTDDAEVESLFTVLASAQVLPPFSHEDLGVETEPPIASEKLGQAFRRVLHYVCGVLTVEPPAAIYRHRDLGGDARLADVRPYALLVGPALFENTDTVELGFRLGRAMALGTPGRIAGSARSGRQLRPYLQATLALARDDIHAVEEDAELAGIWSSITSQKPEVLDHAIELGRHLARTRSEIKLGAWTRALGRTATRVGLLISGDLMRVGRAVAEEEGPEALDALLEFAVSLEHFDLREELGIGTA